MVLILLVPLMFAQVLASRDLGRRRSAAADATVLIDRIGLTTAIGAVYAPAAYEEMASVGLAIIDSLGVERSLVAAALGFDYEPYLLNARVQLDFALDALTLGYGGLVVAGGETVSVRLGDLRRQLAGQRALLDQRTPAGTEIATVMAAMSTLFDELVGAAEAGLSTTNDVELVNVADEVFHLLSMIQAVATETRTNSAGLGAPNGSTLSGDVRSAGGAAEYTIAHYGEFLDADADGEAEWQRLVTSAPVVAYGQPRPQIAQALTERAQVEATASAGGMPAVVTDPEFIRQMAGLLVASFDRLEAFAASVRSGSPF